jgi:hypothetical protein
LLICICCAMLAPAAWGQTADVSAQPGILGYLDPHTGAFRPVPLGGGVEEPDALTTFGGTITVTFTITLKTAGLTSITCSANVSIADQVGTLSTRSYGETATVAATGSGTTRTCKVTIPYAWGLATQGSDSMSTFYTVSGHASAAPGLPIRSSSLFPLDTRKVPANGATTNLTAAVTL